ncbi:hypothetical protein QYE76_069555 [Lolium multiflorum]|uniref:RING-type domain-containing protein n=1 Tax=Lolium multiflorum TaxID=4521 RepID=A0AAD8SIU9_LOLMU|nr:hypothetical protein QYE76_069555 [Lolium multiflorum]
MSAAKKADTKGVPEKSTSRKEAEDTKGGHQKAVETSNVFTLDMDTLECDICSLPFDSQIYTCKNGHAACANCCRSMNRRCGSCTEPIGDFRCRAMEKILASMTRPCKFEKY